MNLLQIMAVCLLCSSWLVASEVTTPPMPVEQLSDVTEHMVLPDVVHLDFTLERHLSLFPEPLMSQGELVIDRQRKAVRWHFDNEVTLILIGDSLQRFGPDGTEEQVNLSRDAAAQALKRQMIGFRDGDWSLLNELVHVTKSTDSGTAHQGNIDQEHGEFPTKTITLEPKDDSLKRLLQRIKVVLRAKNLSPHLLELHGTNGDKTIYRFKAPQFKKNIDEALFTGP